MKNAIKQALLKQLDKRGLTIVKKNVLQYPVNVISEIVNVTTDEKIDSIIFSKDRAIQLNAFIESYFSKVEDAGRLYVIYKAVGEHKKSYEELREIWKAQDVVFVEELNFREQLNEICRQSTAKLIGFYVDDMIFTDQVSYKQILKYDPLKYIVCLSRGLDFNFSQVLNKDLTLPTFRKLNDGSPFYEFNWDYIEEFNDWTYPLGVSAYFYSRAEIVAMFELISYKAPNSLELAMQQMMPYFRHRKGLCMEKVTCTIVPVNLVQEECENPVTGYASIEELLEKWTAGYKVDISKFNGVGVQGIYMNYDYIKRT